MYGVLCSSMSRAADLPYETRYVVQILVCCAAVEQLLRSLRQIVKHILREITRNSLIS